jgi:hypothetical protein
MTDLDRARAAEIVRWFKAGGGYSGNMFAAARLEERVSAALSVAREDGARQERNPKACQDCEGTECSRCGGTGFACISCPTYTRAADMWQARLRKIADADYRIVLKTEREDVHDRSKG